MGDGRHLVATLAMGADAMMLGSRMVVAEEIWAHRDYKKHITQIDERATCVVMSTFGKQHRVLENDTAQRVAALEQDGQTDLNAYRPLLRGELVRQAYLDGNYANGLIDMGPAGVFARAVVPVEAIIDELIDAAAATMRHMNASLRSPATSGS